MRRERGEAPPERMPSRPPGRGAVTPAPMPRPSPPPKPHLVGKPPNPRQPALVRDLTGGVLKDMFEVFPDLPRPARPAPRLRGRARRAGRALFTRREDQ